MPTCWHNGPCLCSGRWAVDGRPVEGPHGGLLPREEPDVPMGDSGGRSRQHRTGEGAVRRNTERERTDVDPAWRIPVPTVSVPMKRASWVVLWVVLGIVIGSLACWSLSAR